LNLILRREGDNKVEKCPLCGGEKKQGYTIYSVDLNFGVVVVKKVPAMICSQCGEEWIDSKTAKKLENIVNSARQTHSELEVLSFQP